MATRESFAIIVAMALLTTFDPGAALQCRLCDSLTNANCWNDMADVELIECGGTVRMPDFGSPSTSHESLTPTTPASSTEPASSTKTEAPAMTNPETEPPFRKSRQIIPVDPEYICYSLIYKSGREDVIERGCSLKTCHQIEATSGGKAQCNPCGHDGCNGSASTGIGLGFFFILAPTALIAVFRW